jgi:hypothetical protein
LVLFALLAAAPVSAQPSVTVITSGLDNPRGIALSPTGSIYVAEAGRGGAGPCFPGPEGSDVCFGASGAITRVFHGGGFNRVVSGVPSVANPDGSAAIGPSDIVFDADGHTFATFGLGADPALRETLPLPGADMAQLSRIRRPLGTWRSIADIGDFEASQNPDGGLPDSNPFGLLSVGRGFVLTDAGGNSLLRVTAARNIQTLAVFPDRMVDAPPFLGLPPGTQIPMQAVPTSVVRRAGNYYVGQLTGFPFPVGAANLYRVPADGGTPEVFASGFTNIIDVALAPDGGFYVLEIAHNSLLSGDLTGGLYHVAADGTKNLLLTEPLFAPGGIAVRSSDGALFITNCGVCPGGGQVLRVML